MTVNRSYQPCRGRFQKRWQTGMKSSRASAWGHEGVERKGPIFTRVLCALGALPLLSPAGTHTPSYRLSEVRPRLHEVIVLLLMFFNEKTGSECWSYTASIRSPTQVSVTSKPVSLPHPTLRPFPELFQVVPPISCGPGSAGGVFH